MPTDAQNALSPIFHIEERDVLCVGPKLHLLIADRHKRSIFVLAALGSACREFTVSALTGFSERRNGVRPPEVFALSRYAENFEKELHFVQIFFKIPFAS